jgi:hypothetical protein
MAALTASMVSCPTAPVAPKPFNGLSRTSLPLKAVPSFAQRTVSNGARTRQMLVWQPVNNKCAPYRLAHKPCFSRGFMCPSPACACSAASCCNELERAHIGSVQALSDWGAHCTQLESACDA